MSNQDAATVAGAILIALDIITVAGRFYSRWSAKAGFGWDDWTILIAMLTGILPGALSIYGAFFFSASSLPFPDSPGRIRFGIATDISRECGCIALGGRGANKTNAPISKQCIPNGARRREQLRSQLRLHSGRYTVHQNHVLDVRVILFYHLYHQAIDLVPPPPHLRHQ